MDKFKLGRKMSCLIVLGISVILGAISSLGYSAFPKFKLIGMQMLDFFDFISNSILMPIIAFITCIFVGFVLKPKTVIDEVSLSGKFKWKNLFSVVIRYVAPICLVVILTFSVLEAFGVVKV